MSTISLTRLLIRFPSPTPGNKYCAPESGRNDYCGFIPSEISFL